MMVGWDEERHRLFCGLLRHMQQSEGATPETSRTPSTVACSTMGLG